MSRESEDEDADAELGLDHRPPVRHHQPILRLINLKELEGYHRAHVILSEP